MKLLKLLCLVLLAAQFTACNIINPEEKIASYVYLTGFDLVDNPLVAEGGLEHGITNAQVFAGGEFIGIFSVPGLVPILQEGPVEMVIDPVIKENGQTFFLAVYPYYTRFSGIVNLVPGQVDSLQIEVQYIDDFEIGFIEDFELGGTIFEQDRDGNEETFMDVTTEEVFDGNRSGLIFLDTANYYIDVATVESDLFPLGDAAQIWLELTIKTDLDVLIGLVGYQSGGSIASSFEFGVLANEGWRKIYFNLEPEILASGFDDYAIALTAGLPLENGKFVLDEASIYLDNIKLLYK
ncbi:MAG: hypothetical protein KDC34_15620 [Saprospiraceae bacterium]|nr:hypothetical protein [Saprospiraceae bacterium]